METRYFSAKLPSPRPNFPFDATEEEILIMQEHKLFWSGLFKEKRAIVVGPVLDPNGSYGFGVITAKDIDEAKSIISKDPANKISKYEVYEMLAMVE